MQLVYTLAATSLVSLGGLLGVVLLWVNQKQLQVWLKSLVAVAAGVMMGVTFFDLLPEAAETLPTERLFPLVLLFFIVMLFVEKVLHWRHCHDGECEVHEFGYMNLIGDAIHNFVDGLLIAATFGVSVPLGVMTTLAVALHEIPQEISDFAVLLYAGFEKRRALAWNFLVASMAILGGVVGVVASETFANMTPYLLVLAGASFLYIATSDLLPELRKESNGKGLVTNMVLFLVGVGLIWGLQSVVGHGHGDDEHGHESVEEHELAEEVDNLEHDDE